MRVAAYVRVSSDEQVQGFSLAAQERAILLHAESHGWEVVDWYRDEGLSARVDDVGKRPAFKRLLDDAQARRFDVVVVHKLDRFARNRRVAFNTFAQLSDWRVGFVSIAENMDYSTPAGQLMLTMLVGMSQFYSDNLSWETKKGKAERKRRGIYNGLLPFGVGLGSDGLPAPDTEATICDIATRSEIVPFEGLCHAFALAAEGRTDREIAVSLNDRGYLTSGNRGRNAFTKDSVRVILRNRFYVGDLPDGDGWIPGRHAPMIDMGLFDRVQHMRARNRSVQHTAATSRQPWAFSGLATCGECGSPMRLNGSGPAGRYVTCSARAQKVTCLMPSVGERDVVEAVGALLARLTVPPEAAQVALNAWRADRSADIDANAKRIAVERKLERLRELYLDGDLSREEYHLRRETLARERDQLPVVVVATEDDAQAMWEVLQTVAAEWMAAAPDQQNVIARTIFERVQITNNRTVELLPRPDFSTYFGTVASEQFRCGGSDGHRSRRSGIRVAVVSLPERDWYAGRRALSPEQVRWIRSQRDRSLRDLATVLGVSRETVRSARR